MKETTQTLVFFVVTFFLVQGKTNAQSRGLSRDDGSRHVVVIAHRGDWKNFPENSIASIKSCIEMGVDVVEIDIRKTKDGYLILMHDTDLSRTTNGVGKVEETTLADIKKLYLKDNAGNLTSHHVPTLMEALTEIKGKILAQIDRKCNDCFAELRNDAGKTQTSGQLLLPVLQTYELSKENYGSLIDKAIMFFSVSDADFKSVDAIREKKTLYPDVNIVAVKFSSENSEVLKAIPALKDIGFHIWAGTIDAKRSAGHDDAAAKKNADASYGWMLAKGVDVIVTDEAELLMNYLAEQGRRIQKSNIK